MYGVLYCVFGAFALLALPIPAQVLTVTWYRVAEMAVFFYPLPLFFALVLGLFLLFKEIFSTCAGIPWLHLGCCLFTPYASPPLRPSPGVAGLVIFAADLLTGCP